MHHDSHFVVRHNSDFSAEHLCLACTDVYSCMHPMPTNVVAANCSMTRTSNACSLAQLRFNGQFLRLGVSLVFPLLLLLALMSPRHCAYMENMRVRLL